VRNPARERSRNLNREVWESPSVYGGEDVNLDCNQSLCLLISLRVNNYTNTSVQKNSPVKSLTPQSD
jgi:hypothetical protein